MNSPQLPIVTPAPMANSGTANTGSANTGTANTGTASSVASTAADVAAVAAEATASREFVAMLAQLMGDGAEVVAAPPAAPMTELTEESVTEPVCELAVPEDVVLADPAIAALLQPQAPATPQIPSTGTRREASNLASQVALTLQAAKAGAVGASTDIIDGAAVAALAAPLADVEKETAAQISLSREGDLSFERISGEGSPVQAQVTAGSSPHARATLAVEARVGSPAWSDQLAAKVSFLNERGIQSASLRLSPEHLGPMEIQISVRDERATVWFGAAHAETRAALEQALPRLREMLQSQGLALADAGVFREPPREQTQDQARAYRVNDSTLATGSDESAVVVRLNRASLVDAYA